MQREWITDQDAFNKVCKKYGLAPWYFGKHFWKHSSIKNANVVWKYQIIGIKKYRFPFLAKILGHPILAVSLTTNKVYAFSVPHIKLIFE
jgi:hypothetical protein